MYTDTIKYMLDGMERYGEQKKLLRGGFYRTISKGGNAYMSYEEYSALYFGWTTADWKDLGTDIKLLKTTTMDYVKGLARNELMVDPDEHQIRYLTCCKVTRQDMPW